MQKKKTMRLVKEHPFFLLIILSMILPGLLIATEDGLQANTRQETIAVPFEISQIDVHPRILNSHKSETVTISFVISQPSQATVMIFDPEMHLVQELFVKDTGDAGRRSIVWDGKDIEGRLVPDEAYFFTVEANNYQGELAIYDPTTLSGGELVNVVNLRFDAENHRLLYELPQDARVSIRAGIGSGGPLLKSIVNWLPRLAGSHHEVWDGRDESRTADVTAQNKYQLVDEAVSLPENSIITSGNESFTFYDYRRNIAPDRPEKQKRPLHRSLLTMERERAQVMPRTGPEPRFRIDLPTAAGKSETGIPIVTGKIPIRITLDDAVKRYAIEQRYEIILFVDYKFITEMEEGYSPASLIWDSRSAGDGEHVVTVNVATLPGRVSSASTRIMVRNP